MDRDLELMFLDWIFKPELPDGDHDFKYPNLKKGLVFLLKQCSCIKMKKIYINKWLDDFIELYFLIIPNDNVENIDIVKNSHQESLREKIGVNPDTYWGVFESNRSGSGLGCLYRYFKDHDGFDNEDPDEKNQEIEVDFNPFIPTLLKSIIKRKRFEVEKFLLSQS